MLNTLSKFQFGDHIRIPKYKNIFAKGYTPDWLKRSICNKKIKNTLAWTSVIMDRNGEDIIGTFYEEESQKINQEEFKTEKIN